MDGDYGFYDKEPPKDNNTPRWLNAVIPAIFVVLLIIIAVGTFFR